MKWKYNNSEEEEQEKQVQFIVNSAASSGGGSVTRVVENNVYFYGDVTESNALELNSTLFEIDRKLSITKAFLDVNPIINLRINSSPLFYSLACFHSISKICFCFSCISSL